MKLIRLDEETGTRIKRSVPKQANVMKRHGSRELTLYLIMPKNKILISMLVSQFRAVA